MMTLESTVFYGKGEIVPHRKGGWAIPGGERTNSKIRAMALAREINKLSGGLTDDCLGLSIMDKNCG